MREVEKVKTALSQLWAGSVQAQHLAKTQVSGNLRAIVMFKRGILRRVIYH